MQKHEEKQSDNEFIKQVQDNGYKFKPDFSMTQGEGDRGREAGVRWPGQE